MDLSFRIRRKHYPALAAAFLAGVVIVSVKADTACHRIIHEIQERRVRNRVSKETAAKWAAWNKTHPNFHPKARPKYKMVPEDVVKQVEVACNVPVTTTADKAPLLPEIRLGDLQPPPLPPPLVPEPVLPSPVEVATAATPPPPFLPPYSAGPPVLTQTPEPSSLALMLTGGIAISAGVFARTRRRFVS